MASHLTCVGTTVDQLRDYLREAQERGIGNIVALRGDPPKGETQFQAVAGGLRYANELVELIRRDFPAFGVAVATRRGCILGKPSISGASSWWSGPGCSGYAPR